MRREYKNLGMYDIDPANVRLRELQTFPSYMAQLNHLECELEEMYRHI